MNRQTQSWSQRFLESAEWFGEYTPSLEVNSLANRLGLKPSQVMKLDANENFFMSLLLLRSLLSEVINEIDPRLYPQNDRMQLREALAEYLEVSPEQILLGAGGDQLIELLSNTFLRDSARALSITPTFSIYERAVGACNAAYDTVNLKDDFSFDLEEMIALIAPKTQVIFLCSPNNPTANQFMLDDILSLIENFHGLVVIDETYVEFASYSATSQASEYDNLVVLRSFSKVFGLAGLRLGYAVANQEVTSALRSRVQMPYSVSKIALKLGLKILQKREFLRGTFDCLKNERTKLIQGLNEIHGIKAFDSETNFVLFSLQENVQTVYQDLLNKGIIVRKIGKVSSFQNCLRVTVTPPDMTERFLQELQEVLL